MSKLSNLIGKPKTFNIGGETLEFRPRTMADMDLIMRLGEPEKAGDAMKELISKTLKDAVPDATDEELDQVALNHFKTLSEAIIEVNGLNVPPTNR